MLEKFKSLPVFVRNLLAFLLMIAIGIAATMVIKKNKEAISPEDTEIEARPVDILTVKIQSFTPQILAYGNIEPAKVLQGKAEVSGRISYVHPDLKQGGSIAKGTVVVRVDPDDYQSSLKQTEASLATSKAQLEQLKQEEKSTKRSLKLANDKLRLGQQELGRVKKIWNKRLIARSALDAENQKVIQLRQSVSDVEGKLATYSSRLAAAKANISRSKSQVKGKETTLGRTEIRMPFDARISALKVEKGQFTPVGGVLFEAMSTDAIEVNAEIPIPQMRTLLAALRGKSLNMSAGSFLKTIQSLNLNAQITLVDGKQTAKWDAQVARFSESVDPIRNTMAITVVVDKPYENVIIGERPPLMKGMYVGVKLAAPAYDAIVLPRKALHLGRVYLLGDDNKLVIRKVDIQSEQGGDVVIASGLEEGDNVILNDLIPVIEGMPLVSTQPIPKASPATDKKDQPASLPRQDTK